MPVYIVRNGIESIVLVQTAAIFDGYGPIALPGITGARHPIPQALFHRDADPTAGGIGDQVAQIIGIVVQIEKHPRPFLQASIDIAVGTNGAPAAFDIQIAVRPKNLEKGRIGLVSVLSQESGRTIPPLHRIRDRDPA